MSTKKADTEKLRRAGEAVRLVLGRLRPLLEAGEELERVGGLEQAIGESQQRLAAAQTEERAARNAIDEATRKAREILDSATRQAEATVSAASETARAANDEEVTTRKRLSDVASELRDAETRLAAARDELAGIRQRAQAL